MLIPYLHVCIKSDPSRKHRNSLSQTSLGSIDFSAYTETSSAVNMQKSDMSKKHRGWEMGNVKEDRLQIL